MKELSYPTSMPVPVLSVVIPCHNEQGHIETLISQWTQALVQWDLQFELIVINDGSLDGTSRVLDRLRKEMKNLRIVHQLNSGHEKAVQRGYELSRGEWILQLDSSGRFDPSDFSLFWSERESHDLIVASRTHRLDSLLRQFSIRLLSSLIESLFKIRIEDPDVSFRLFRRSFVLEKMKLLPTSIQSFNLAMTVLMKSSIPNRVREVKVPFRLRALRKGRLGILQILHSLKYEISEMLKLRYVMKRLCT